MKNIFLPTTQKLATVLGVLLPIFLWWSCQTAQNHQKNNASSAISPQDSAAWRFSTYCGSCHGAKGENFVNRVWKYGNTKEHIAKSIKMGSLDAGMPPFEQVFTAQQIAELADFVLEASKKRAVTEGGEKAGIFVAKQMKVRLDTIAADLDSPWGMAFLPNGEMLFTDRAGKLFIVNDRREKTMITGVPKVLYDGQGGLLDVVLHPKFSENKLIYLSYSKFKDSINARWSTTAVLQARLEGNELKNSKDIFIAQPYAKTKHHYGGRLAFDKAGMLFFSVGDRGNHFRNPQRLDNDCGKIHRIFDDGRIPKDNPFASMDTARPTIWSYGHRNPQGLVIAEDGTIWEHEHGPKGGDELNIISKGANYGWPTISYGINYDGSVLTPITTQTGMEQPQNYWIPSIAPCGMTICQTNRYPAWKGDIMIGSLSFEYLNRCKLDGNKIKEQEILLPKIGRVRCVAIGKDGYMYVAVEKKGFIFKLIPF